MNKPKKIVPPFFQIKIVNKMTASLAMIDFATSPEEAEELIKQHKKTWPEPAYAVRFNGWPVLPITERK